LEYLGPAVVSTTLRKNRVLGIDSLDCKIVPMVAISLFFTSALMPPIDTSSPNAAGSLFPPNHMSSDPFSKTITYCELKKKKKKKKIIIKFKININILRIKSFTFYMAKKWTTYSSMNKMPRFK
jgi:hypothetical protein